MNAHTTHPLVESYLRDLEGLLQGIDAGERAEVLAGVREHLDGALPAGAGDDQVRSALAELGSPQAIADEAYASEPRPPAGRGPMSRPWVPLTVGILLGLALLGIVLAAGSLAAYSTSETVGMDAAGNEITDEDLQFSGVGPAGAVMALMFTWIFWLPATVLAVASPLWTGRQKVALALLGPGSAAVLVGLPELSWAFARNQLAINAAAWTSLVLVVIGGGWLLIRLCRAAARRSST